MRTIAMLATVLVLTATGCVRTYVTEARDHAWVEERLGGIELGESMEREGREGHYEFALVQGVRRPPTTTDDGTVYGSSARWPSVRQVEVSLDTEDPDWSPKRGWTIGVHHPERARSILVMYRDPDGTKWILGWVDHRPD